jgi:ABC-type multidrug transport system ATPase subunit
MLATLLRPSGGSIRYGTMHAAGAPPELRGRIGVLGHDLFLYPELTARENLAFFAGLYGRRDADDAARAALTRAVSPIAATISCQASRAACVSGSHSSAR